ncbi:MAG: VWA domain-containing protein [Anaerolineae bacterium]
MSPPRRGTVSPGRMLVSALVVGGVFFAACAACWSVFSALLPEVAQVTPTAQPDRDVLLLACSPEKRALVEEVIAQFHALGQTASDGRPMRIHLVEMDGESMVDAALAGEVHAILPDSSLWLDILDRRYAERAAAQDSLGAPRSLTSGVTRWAISPVVIAMWEDTARSLGWPDKLIGWEDLLERAQRDPSFRWSHPSTSSASGLLATLAQFYAAAGITRGLTPELARSEAVINYVSAIQKTVRFYGEGEWTAIQRALQEGKRYLDAFVVQEQLVVYFNQQPQRPAHLVAIYPAEGTLWEDHPLALIETPGLSSSHREIYQAFRNYLTSKTTQQRVLQAGYRPADLSIPIQTATSPINPENGVDPSQPQTTLQMPSPSVVDIVRDVWWLTKRHANVYLVVDTSGSMQGDKLARVKEALVTFIDQIKSEQERVGLIAFSSAVYYVDELERIRDNRSRLLATIGGLEAEGNTALLDAVWEAYEQLQRLADRERINAIVVMTDGQENNSWKSLGELEAEIQRGNAHGVPIVIFCIAYGEDADMETLRRIAEASGGMVRVGDLETIRRLYKLMATYF